jgi:hypothetical protein
MDHRFELGGRRIGAGLLDEPQGNTQDHHNNHQHPGDDIGLGFGRGERNDCKNHEQNHKRIQARPNEEPQACKAMFVGDHVGAAFFQTSLSFLFGKALRFGPQLGKHLGGRNGSSADEPG